MTTTVASEMSHHDFRLVLDENYSSAYVKFIGSNLYMITNEENKPPLDYANETVTLTIYRNVVNYDANAQIEPEHCDGSITMTFCDVLECLEFMQFMQSQSK